MSERKTGAHMGQELMNWVNAFGFDAEGFAKAITRGHPTLQQSVMRLFMATIDEWAKKPLEDHWDDRNRATIEAAHKIVEATKDIGFPMI